MGKVWVLQTETKGTGANVVPLERAIKPSPAASEPVFVPRKPRPRQPEAPEPRPPHRFRVVDVMTREALADDASAHQALAALRGVRSIVDVDVYVWHEEQARWRMLTFAEQRAMWELAGAQR